MHDDIRQLGVQAAREGLTLWDCPYFKAEEMPGHTGRPLVEWRQKVDAWEAGWKEEFERRLMIRSPF